MGRCSRSWLGGFHDLVFGGIDGCLDFFVVGLLGVKGDVYGSAHVADFVDVYNTIGLGEDGGEMVAAGLAGEALDFNRSSVAGDLDSVLSDSFLDVGDLHFVGVILDHDSAGLGAGRAVGDAGHGSKSDFGGLGGTFFSKTGDSELHHGTTAVVSTGSSFAFAGGTLAGGAFFGGGSFLSACERSEG